MEKNIDQHASNDRKAVFNILLIGIISVLVPFISIPVITLGGASMLSRINGTMLLILSVLLILFIIIKSINFYNNDLKKGFIVGVIFALLCIISFAINLSVYILI